MFRRISLKRILGKKFTPLHIITYIFTGIFVFFFIFPLYWQIVTAIKPPEEIYKMPPLWFPTVFYLQRFYDVLRKTGFLLNLRNSAIVASLTTVLCLSFSVLSSYAIARIKIKGGKMILIVVMIISMLPAVAVIAPLYLIWKELQLINTVFCLIITYVAIFLPFSMWFLTSFFRTIPPHIEEAAMIDGCTPLQALIKIIIPLSAPAVFTIAMLVYIWSWNEFLFALTFTRSDSARTVAVGIYMFRRLWQIPWGNIAVACTIATVPIVVLVLTFQKYIIHGLTAGALKG